MSARERNEKLKKMANEETKGMDFTYIIDQIKGNKLSPEQETAKNAVNSVKNKKNMD